MEIADVDNNRSYALQFVVAHFLIPPVPIYRGFIGETVRRFEPPTA